MDFNEIKNSWKDSFKKEKLLDKDQVETLLKIKNNSNTAINKIRNSYKIELIAGTIMYLIIVSGLFWFIKSSAVFIFFVLVTLLLGGGIYFAWISYKKINKTIFASERLKPTLIKTINDVEMFMNFGRSSYVKFLIIPFSILLGMFIGLYIGSHFSSGAQDIIKTILTLERSSIIKIVLVLIVGGGVTILYSQFMLKRMYKQHLDELKRCLNEFEEEEEEEEIIIHKNDSK